MRLGMVSVGTKLIIFGCWWQNEDRWHLRDVRCCFVDDQGHPLEFVIEFVINTILVINIDVRAPLKTVKVIILSMLAMNVTAMNWFGTAAKQLIKAHMAEGQFLFNKRTIWYGPYYIIIEYERYKMSSTKSTILYHHIRAIN